MLPPRKFSLFTILEPWRAIRNRWHGTSSHLEPLLESTSETGALGLDEDIDVQTERNRVLSGSADNAIIYLRNLRKVLVHLVCITLTCQI